MKHYTTIEQSKKLLELGLSPETADMYWEYNHNIHIYNDIPRIVVIKNWDDKYNKNIPCWSLGTLLEVMPTGAHIEKRNNNYACYTVYNKPYEADTPIEAAFDMVVYLLENNYIK